MLRASTSMHYTPTPQQKIGSGRTMLKLAISDTWSGLPEELASELFAKAICCRLKAEERLFQAGDKGDGCYRLDKGLLKVILTSPQAKERIIAVLKPGAIGGDLAVIDGLPRSASVIALTECELRFVSRIAFQQFARRHPEIYQYFLEMLAARLRETDNTIAALAFLSLKGRVARALLALAKDLGEETGAGGMRIPCTISQRDLAAMAGVARENANRVLAEWERREIVTKSAGFYWISDSARLAAEIDY